MKLSLFRLIRNLKPKGLTAYQRPKESPYVIGYTGNSQPFMLDIDQRHHLIITGKADTEYLRTTHQLLSQQLARPQTIIYVDAGIGLSQLPALTKLAAPKDSHRGRHLTIIENFTPDTPLHPKEWLTNGNIVYIKINPEQGAAHITACLNHFSLEIVKSYPDFPLLFSSDRASIYFNECLPHFDYRTAGRFYADNSFLHFNIVQIQTSQAPIPDDSGVVYSNTRTKLMFSPQYAFDVTPPVNYTNRHKLRAKHEASVTPLAANEYLYRTINITTGEPTEKLLLVDKSFLAHTQSAVLHAITPLRHRLKQLHQTYAVDVSLNP